MKFLRFGVGQAQAIGYAKTPGTSRNEYIPPVPPLGTLPPGCTFLLQGQNFFFFNCST